MSSADKLIISPSLIGRTQEMEILRVALRSVQRGKGQVVLLAGEAGVGKSRLIAEIRQHALTKKFTLLEGHCFECDAVFLYAPLIDALRAFLGPQPAAVVVDLLGGLAAELVKLLPELALAIPHVQPTPDLPPEAEKRRLFETLVQFLLRLTQRPSTIPLLLILEDLHWGDETSLDFLHLLARRVTAYPVFVLATYRCEEVSPPLQRLLTELSRGRLAREVVLSPLTPSEVHALLQAVFALRRPVPAKFLKAIYALTEGNPFFIEEVLQTLIAAGDIFDADGEWTLKSMEELHIPPSLQNAVQRRIAPLSHDARQLLTLAAVAGRRFDFGLLQAVTGRDEDELLMLIKELVAAQLVVEEIPERFAFRHALTRQAVCDALLGRERRAFHRTVGEASEHVYGRDLDAQTGDLAYHFYEAGEWTKAFEYAWRAGEQAQARYAPYAAVEQFTRALVAAQHLAQPPSRLPLYQARGLAYDTLGEFEHARSDLEAALELTRTMGDRTAAWKVLLDLGQLWASRDYRQAGDYFQQALMLADTLDDPAAQVQCLNRVGNWHLNLDQPRQALHYHQKALAIVEPLGDQQGLADTFDLLGVATGFGADLVQGARYLHQAIALYQTLDNRQGLSSSLAMLTVGTASTYGYEVATPALTSPAECLKYGERALQLAQEIGWRAGEALALLQLAFILNTQGQYGQALEQAQRGLEIAEEIEHHEWTCLAHTTVGLLYLDLFAQPAARHHLEKALALAKQLDSLIHIRLTTRNLVTLLVVEQDLKQAEALLNTALSQELPMESMAQRWLWTGRAELALAQRDPTLAVQIVDQLLASAPNVDRDHMGAIPYLARLRGEGLAALGYNDEAEAMLLAAQATTQAHGALRLLWPIHAALGHFYQGQKCRDEAAHAAVDARTVIDKIAATVPDLHLRDTFVREAVARLPATSRRQLAKATYGGLTERELEVAMLAAQGRTNREIADELVISKRTAEDHIRNICVKLKLKSRHQIAGWLCSKEGLAPPH